MKKIVYSYTLKTPVLISDFSGDTNTRQSLDHISGTVLLGIVGGWLARKQISIDGLTIDDLVLTSKISFSDAIISYTGSPTLPVPLGWYHLKGQKAFPSLSDGETDAPGTIQAMYNRNIKPNKEEPWKPVASGWLTWLKNIPHRLEVKHTTHIHNAIDPDKGRPNEDTGGVFVYEALREKQTFTGEIRFADDKLANRFYQAVKDQTEVRLGKSVAAEYGSALVHWNLPVDVKTPAFNPERMHLVLVSDAILMNRQGQYQTELTAGWMKGWLEMHGYSGIRVTNLNDMVDYFKTRLIPGFNSKWGQFRQTVPGIVRGSVFHFCFKGHQAAEAVGFLQQYGIGERRQEGFGRLAADHPLLIRPEAFNGQQVKFKSQVQTTESNTEYRSWWQLPDMPKSVQKAVFVKQMQKRVSEILNEYCFANEKLKNKFKDKPGNSQLQGLRNRALIAKQVEEISSFMKTKEGKKAYKDGHWDAKINFAGEEKRLFEIFSESIVNKEKFFEFLGFDELPESYREFHLEAVKIFINQLVGTLIKSRENNEGGNT